METNSSQSATYWKPKEILIHHAVLNDPVTRNVLSSCPGVPVKTVSSAKSDVVVAASDILRAAGDTILDKLLAGKRVLFISPAGASFLDVFDMHDDRLMCPKFQQLKFASNGCFYECDWCYLKATYRAAHPFIQIRAQYGLIKKTLQDKLAQSRFPIMFSNGETQDSLALEHLTGSAKEFIPFFAQTGNGYLYLLTKSDNVDGILDLPHNGHTVVAWSMNEPSVSSRFEIGAAPFRRRLSAAKKIQQAGYKVRVRLDPIIPIDGWKDAYADTIKQIFKEVALEGITLGTLRFEETFFKMRDSIFTTGKALPALMSRMVPMFPPKKMIGYTRPKKGKYTFPESERLEIFNFAISEIRKYSDCPIALCKQSKEVWEGTGLDLSTCSCACQLKPVDMTV